MRVRETKLDGVWIIEPDVYGDHRGWFSETYTQQKFEALGITTVFIQDNHSFSQQKGTLRGLHFQKAPYAQTKLVRCTRGSIMDVAVDIRKGSPTYKAWVAVEVSAANHRQMYIPKGFAHGFVTLMVDTEVQYKVDAYYAPACDRSIRYDDVDLGIDWGVVDPILSEKDLKAPTLAACDHGFCYGEGC